jgi:hypothetical protein
LGGFCSNQRRSCSGVSSRNSGVSSSTSSVDPAAADRARRRGPRGAPPGRSRLPGQRLRGRVRAVRLERVLRKDLVPVEQVVLASRAAPRDPPAAGAVARRPRAPRPEGRPARGVWRAAPEGPKASASFCSSSPRAYRGARFRSRCSRIASSRVPMTA